MKALYYRYLFENVENGMIQAGSIYNEENDCSVNYVYLSGNPTNSNINDGVSSKDSSRTNDITGIGILEENIRGTVLAYCMHYCKIRRFRR